MRNLTKIQIVLISVLFTFGAVIRFYNFNNRLTFGPEQAISVINSAEKISHFTLLGMPYLQRQTSTGMNLFHTPHFPYSLIPFQLIFNYDPYPLTVYFVLLNLFTAFLLFYLVLRLTRSFLLSFLATFFFLFDPHMVHHSLFIWIVNYFPLFGLLTGFLLIQLLLSPKTWHPFVLGILTGIGVGLDLAYVTLIPFILILLLVPKHRLFNFASFIAAAILVNLPTIIFDLRHDFFHIRIFYQFFQDYLNGQASPLITYYHFLHFYPFFFVILAMPIVLFGKVIRKPYFLAVIVAIMYLFKSFQSPYINLQHSIGMPPGITLEIYQDVAHKIKEDSPQGPFNIATLHDFDTRAHPLRYLLTYTQNLVPKSVEEYHNLNTLYVLAPDSYDFSNPQVFELQAHAPYQKTLLHEYQGYDLVKLTK